MKSYMMRWIGFDKSSAHEWIGIMLELLLFFGGTLLFLLILALPVLILVRLFQLSVKVRELEGRLDRLSTSEGRYTGSVHAQTAAAYDPVPARAMESAPAIAAEALPDSTAPVGPHRPGALHSSPISEPVGKEGQNIETASDISRTSAAHAPFSVSAHSADSADSAVSSVSADSAASSVSAASADFRSTDGRYSTSRSPHSASVSEAADRTARSAAPQYGFQGLIKSLEQRLATNWTGILGTIILVIGAGFLGIYAALKMGPFLRFLMVLGLSVALFIVSLLLQRKAHWRPLSFWIRSGSGAVLLFACVGSALVPALQWIQDENLALVIVLVGVGMNLLFAYLASAQTFASIHTFLSILALLILPVSPLILSIITGIGIFSAYLSYRARWEFHLLQTTGAYLLALVVYYVRAGLEAEMPADLRWIGLAGTVTVSLLALYVHYRPVYHGQVFERWPFVSHLLSWVMLGVGVVLYAPRLSFVSFILFAAALLVYFHAKRARRSGASWLYRTDSLIALLMALMGAINLGQWGWDKLAIMSLSSFVLTLFSVAASEERESILYRTGMVLLPGSWFIQSVSVIPLFDEERVFYQSAMLGMGLLSALIVVFHQHFRNPILRASANTEQAAKRTNTANETSNPGAEERTSPVQGKGEDRWNFQKSRHSGDHIFWPDPSYSFTLSGLFAGILFGLQGYLLRDVAFAPHLLCGLALILLSLRRIFSLSSLRSSYVPILLGLHYLILYRGYGLGPVETLWLDTPLLLLFLGGLLLSHGVSHVTGQDYRERHMGETEKADPERETNQPRDVAETWTARIACSLFLAHLAVLIHVLAEPYSSLLPGVIWLLGSLLILEFGRLLKSRGLPVFMEGLRNAAPVWFLGALSFVLLFLVAHLFVHLQSEALIGPFRVRLLIQVLAIATFLYWALSSPASQKYDRGLLARIPTLFWELTLVFLTLTLALELQTYLPAVWAGVAILLFMFRGFSFVPDRLGFYGILFFWVSVIHVAFLSTREMPSAHWLDRSWMGGVAAIAAQLLFLLLHYSPPAFLRSVATDRMDRMDWLTGKLQKSSQALLMRKDLFLFYPLFFSVALFLFWSFDQSILTILWMVEVFVVFFVGLKLKQDHFRYVAHAAMVLCIGRLVLFDMAQSSVIMKAFAFLGVGAIMILMNAIYNRYRSAGEDP